MAATFTWAEHNTSGQVETTGVSQCNWKTTDTPSDDYASHPITAGNWSMDKFQYGKFGGNWNQLTNCKYGVSAVAPQTDTVLYGSKSMSAAGDRVSWRTPVTGTAIRTNATVFATTDIDRVLFLSKTSPDDASATATITGGTGITAYTCYLYTKLETIATAPAGDTNTVTISLSYDES